MAIEVPCVLEKIVYRNDTGFAILGVNLNAFSNKYSPELEKMVKTNCPKNKYDNFSVTTTNFNLNDSALSQQFIFIGEFVNDKKYGGQFKAELFFQDVPKTEDGFRYFLMTFPNIKETRSQLIIDTFGVEGTIDILDNDPYKLTEIHGITEKRIPPIKLAWDENKTLRELYDFLIPYGISAQLIKNIHKNLGISSKAEIEKNPYVICKVKGISFIAADNMAHKLPNKVSQEDRLIACMSYVLEKDIATNSNVCMPFKKLKIEVVDLLKKCNENNDVSDDSKDYLNIMSTMIKDNLDVFTAVKDLSNNIEYIYLSSMWEKEKYIAKELCDRKRYDKKKITCSDEDVANAQKDVREFSGINIVLDETQKEAIKSAFEHKLTVITGGGGTGKSTICRCIYDLASQKGLSIRLMSPTGKASQVLADKTGAVAETIHRSLKLRPGDDLPKEEITEDIIILDEVSMVGLDTMYPFLVAMEANIYGNIVLVGDSNQLPSVSPGNLLADIIESNCANVVRLDRVHRQSKDSYISLLANDIAKGKVVEVPPEASDIEWRSIGRTENFVKTLVRDVKEFLDDGHELEELQLLAPMYKGYCGVDRINEAMQTMACGLNSSEKDFIQRDFIKYHRGDRIIQTKNNYDKQIFNGDMGVILELGKKIIDSSVSDEKEHYIEVDFNGNRVMYVGAEIDQMALAWCCTVHKYQGSQAQYVMFVIVDEANRMMNKELVYTAMTRASRYLYLYGHINQFKIAPTKSVIRKRYTNINKIIKSIETSEELLKILDINNTKF